MIFVTVYLPSRKAKDKDCWLSPVAKKRNVNASFSAGNIALHIQISF